MMKRSPGRPRKLEGFKVTRLKGQGFYLRYCDAGYTLLPKLRLDKPSKLVVERHVLIPRGAVAWITGRSDRAVTGWQERKLLRVAGHFGNVPLFDIADVAHLVATGQFRAEDEPLCREALAVKYFWTVPGLDRRPNKPGSIADELDKQYRELLEKYPGFQEEDKERRAFWGEAA